MILLKATSTESKRFATFESLYSLFKVELKKPNGAMEYHVARDVSIVKKSDSFAPGTFWSRFQFFRRNN